MKQTLELITSALSTFSVITVVAVCALLVLTRMDTPLKLRAFTVLSGSMEPVIPTGAIVFVQQADSYQVNDVITVVADARKKMTVTHRVVDVDTVDGKRVYTLKGDANEEVDRQQIAQDRVVGKVVTFLPYVGRVIQFAQTQAGFIALIVVPATIIAYSELMTIKDEIRKSFAQRKPKTGRMILA